MINPLKPTTVIYPMNQASKGKPRKPLMQHHSNNNSVIHHINQPYNNNRFCNNPTTQPSVNNPI